MGHQEVRGKVRCGETDHLASLDAGPHGRPRHLIMRMKDYGSRAVCHTVSPSLTLRYPHQFARKANLVKAPV